MSEDLAGCLDDIHLATPYTFGEQCVSGWQSYDWITEVGRFITKRLAQGNARLAISAPPRHGKSEFMSFTLPLWHMIRWPHKRVMHATYEATLSAFYTRRVRNWIREKGAQFGVGIRQDLAKDREWGTTAMSPDGEWRNTEFGGMMGAGVGGAFTGRGGDLLICDDPIKGPEQASSPAYIDKLRSWFEGVFMPRVEPGGNVIVLHTRWNDDDLIGYITNDSEEEWEYINLPALSDVETDDFLNREPGLPLCPERFTVKDLEAIKHNRGGFVWLPMYQGNVGGTGGNIFKRMWFKTYDGHTLPDGARLAGWSWDLAFKKSPQSSFVSGQLWFKCGPDYYLREEVHDRLSFTESVAVFEAACKRTPHVTAKLVEDKANGPALIDMMKKRVSGIIPINPADYGGDKVARAVAVSPLVEAGNVYIPDPQSHPWVAAWLDEICRFPLAKRNDRVDAFSQFINWCHKGNRFFV